MKNGRMQAKDISDVEFVSAVRAVQVRRAARDRRRRVGLFASERGRAANHLPWATFGLDYSRHAGRYDDEDAVLFRRQYGPFLNDYFPMVPAKVLRAKGQRVIDRRLMDGCMCGCRGDMMVTHAGLELLDVAVVIEVEPDGWSPAPVPPAMDPVPVVELDPAQTLRIRG